MIVAHIVFLNKGLRRVEARGIASCVRRLIRATQKVQRDSPIEAVGTAVTASVPQGYALIR